MDTNSYKKSNFGSAFFFLSKKQKEALGLVYAFCRYADDIVDDNFENAPKLLAELKQDLITPQKKFFKNLEKVIEDYSIPKQYFFDLIDGVEYDLKKPVRFETFENLEWYIYRVAGVVGLMCIHIFGFKNQQTKQYAITLAKAVQMTNILRDIAEDSKIDRVYLPLEDLKNFKVSQEDILKTKDTPEITKLLAFERQRTEAFYKQAELLLPKEDFKNMFAARIMGNIYKAIFDKTHPCKIFKHKLKLNKIQKIFIVLKTWSNIK
ncbi:MAG: squalene/phytoene synthase family protein [Elusimicrobiaceae bacterium]|nr:squalene/phytoene synthase family protein [Elusimicrobiaceae bacterium]